MATETPPDEPRPRKLRTLLRDLLDLIPRLIRDEVRSLRAEITTKLQAVAVGAALTAIGVVIALFALGTLISAAVAGLELVLPHWLAALLVAVALLLIAGVFALAGITKLKRGTPPVPTQTIDSVKDDVRALKGTRS